MSARSGTGVSCYESSDESSYEAYHNLTLISERHKMPETFRNTHSPGHMTPNNPSFDVIPTLYTFVDLQNSSHFMFC